MKKAIDALQIFGLKLSPISSSTSTSKGTLSRYGPPVALALFGFIVGIAATWRVFGFDDAVVMYIFARNLTEGNGIIWNSDILPIYGSTTFAYALILALAGYLGFAIPTASIVPGALFWAGSYLVLFWTLENTVGRIPILLTILMGVVLLEAISLSRGMEFGFYAFLAILAFALYGKIDCLWQLLPADCWS